VGHLFGLGHPDVLPLNLLPNIDNYNPHVNPQNVYQEMIAANGRVDATSCGSLWNGTHAGVPPWLPTPKPNGVVELGSGGYPVRNSVMEAFTQHNPKPCLTDDDVEALATLYPDCSIVSHSTNICLITYHNIGFVRIIIYFLFPLLLALLLIIIFSSVVHWYHQKELKKTRSTLESTKLQLAVSRLQAAKDRTVEQLRRQREAMAALRVRKDPKDRSSGSDGSGSLDLSVLDRTRSAFAATAQSFTRSFLRKALGKGGSGPPGSSPEGNQQSKGFESREEQKPSIPRWPSGLVASSAADPARLSHVAESTRADSVRASRASFIGQRHSCSDLGRASSGMILDLPTTTEQERA